MRLWDVSSAGCIRLFHGHKGPVTCAAISPDGQLAASASADRTVRVWHLANGKALCAPLTTPSLQGSAVAPRAVCFSSSGRLLAVCGERSVAIWETRDLPRETTQPTLAYQSPVPIMSASFLPSHTVLVAAGLDVPERVPAV